MKERVQEKEEDENVENFKAWKGRKSRMEKETQWKEEGGRSMRKELDGMEGKTE